VSTDSAFVTIIDPRSPTARRAGPDPQDYLRDRARRQPKHVIKYSSEPLAQAIRAVGGTKGLTVADVYDLNRRLSGEMLARLRRFLRREGNVTSVRPAEADGCRAGTVGTVSADRRLRDKRTPTGPGSTPAPLAER